MAELDSCVPFPIDEEALTYIASRAKEWALIHGMGFRSSTHYSVDLLEFSPFILCPSPFPRREFEEAVRLQPIFNELMYWVAQDAEFLREALTNTIKVDEFTRNLFNIHERVLADNKSAQPISIGLFRADFMLSSTCCADNDKKRPYCCWKQVEINTLSFGLAQSSPLIRELHSYVLSELNHGEKIVNLPKNDALTGLCTAIVEAWKLKSSPNAVILLVPQLITYNFCDVSSYEFYIRKAHPEIKIIRRTLTEIYQQAKLGPNNELLINNLEVSVVFYRTGYAPEQYPSQNEWDARYLLEKSAAIKCPSIHFQLAVTKKVQQALAKPGILKRFLTDDTKIEAITKRFTGLYAMDSDTEEGQKALQIALSDPTNYVLKPELDCGGNNIFGNDIPDALRNMSEADRSAWILMERIIPPTSKGYMIRPGDSTPPALIDLNSELGIFGAVIGDKNGIIYNTHCGHALRTKLETSNECTIIAGYGAFDSPYLYDD